MNRMETAQKVDSLLTEIFVEARTALIEEDANAIKEFIEVGEYGLAYERLVDCIPKDAPHQMITKLDQAGQIHGIWASYNRRFRGTVNDSFEHVVAVFGIYPSLKFASIYLWFIY